MPLPTAQGHWARDKRMYCRCTEQERARQERERAQALAEMKARQALEAKLLAEEEQALQVWLPRRWKSISVLV